MTSTILQIGIVALNIVTLAAIAFIIAALRYAPPRPPAPMDDRLRELIESGEMDGPIGRAVSRIQTRRRSDLPAVRITTGGSSGPKL